MTPNQLKLQWLWYFMDVAETKNFTKTAERNFTSQSNVSYAMKCLEKVVGAPLLVRRDNDITLSAFGEAFLPYVKDAFASLSDGCSYLNGMINPISGCVKIGFSFTFSLSDIPGLYKWLYADFERNGTNITLYSVMAHVNEDIRCVEDLVLDGTCDLGITCVQARNGCSFTKITEQELVILTARDHPISKQRSVTLNELKDERFILLKGDSELQGYYESMFKECGIKPKLLNPGLDWPSIFLQVSSGHCLTIAPRARYDDYNVSAITLDHPMKFRDVFIATPMNRKINAAANYTKSKIAEYFARHQASD